MAFGDYNPISTAIYYICVIGITVFCMNPILLFCSFIGSLLFYLLIFGSTHVKKHLYYSAVFLVAALLNPLVSHNGATVLFVLNDSPITLEALLYGISAALMIVSVLYRFDSLTHLLTSDKLLYLFAAFSPKLSQIISMALRYVPLFSAQAKKINEAQTTLGIYKDGNIIDRISARLRIFSVLITQSLENGIITAESMESRGYGSGKRSHFSIFRFCLHDLIFCMVTVSLFTLTCISIAFSAPSFKFYPHTQMPALSPLTVSGYVSYLILSFLPCFIEIFASLKWRYKLNSYDFGGN